MAIQERTCKECGNHWELWRQFMKDLPKRPACPKCGSRKSKVEIVGNLPKNVLFKGGGWTPKSGTVKDLREVKGFDSPNLAGQLEG